MTDATTTPPELLTKSEAARALKVCVRTIENLMAARRLSYISIGRAIRLERNALERFKESQTVHSIG